MHKEDIMMENDELNLEELEFVSGGMRNESAKYEEYAKKKAAEKKVSFAELQDYIASMTPQQLENVDATMKKIDDFINSRAQNRSDNENTRD